MRTRKAWITTVRGHDGESCCYAETAAAARAETISDVRDVFECAFIEAARAVRVRRARHLDVHLPERHPLAERMPPRLLHMIVHAYGGKSLRAGQRGYFYTSGSDLDMCRLVFEWGMFSGPHRNGICDDDYGYFYLTGLGRLVAAGEQPLYPRC